MDFTDINFVPHNDMHPDDIDLVEQHKNLIESKSLSGATALLDENDYQKGFRASLFDSIEKKLQQIQIYLLNKYVAESDEFYSIEEPSAEFMEENNYKYWIQPY